MIAPVEGSDRLDNRLIDRLLGWWDHGGGKRMRRWCRTTTTTVGGHISDGTRTVGRRIAELPITQRLARWLAPVTRSTATLTRPVIDRASQMLTDLTAETETTAESAQTPSREPVRSRTRATEIPRGNTNAKAGKEVSTARIQRRLPTPGPETKTAESYTDQLAALVKGRDSSARPTNAGTTGLHITASQVTVSDGTASTTSMLRCWSCKRRSAVRSPRRGGCCRCTTCQAVMLVVDPVVGLTCDVAQADERGINVSREANETDPG
jgi:hypothetical protein